MIFLQLHIYFTSKLACLLKKHYYGVRYLDITGMAWGDKIAGLQAEKKTV